jgi:DNA transformation protein
VANRPKYLEFLREQLAPLGELTARAMFGGHILYCDGIVFALVDNDELYLKADNLNRGEFQARGLHGFRPYPDKPEGMNYYQAPPELFEDRDALIQWGRAAVAAGRRAQVKKKPRKR